MAFDALDAGISYDDLMNLTHAWRPGLEALVWDNVLFYEIGSAHRPLGELFYWVFYNQWGFDAWPYRVACLALLGANTALLFIVCRSIDLPRHPAFLSGLFHGYHYGFSPLYYNTGTCYDLLAFFFYFSAILSYIRIRQGGRASVAGTGVLLALTILGLNSKELVVTLPAVLAAYELLWRRQRAPSLRQWLREAALSLGSVGAVTLLYSIGHFMGASSLRNMSSYAPDFSRATYTGFLERTFVDAFYAFGSPPWAVAAVGSAVVIAIVVGLRQRGPTFGLVVFLAGAIPIAFIQPRALSAAYIPTAGLAIVFGAGLASIADAVRGRGGRGWILRWAAAVTILVFVAVFVVRKHIWVKRHSPAAEIMAEASAEITSVRTRLQELIPDPAPGSRILLFKDPFLQLDEPWFKEWASVFLVKLLYDDVHIDQHFRLDPPPDAASVAGYDYVLTSRNARLERVQ